MCVRKLHKAYALKFGADVGLSVTGIAGPDGGTPTKPVGLTYIALCGPFLEEINHEKKQNDGIVKEFRFQWDRNKNRTITVTEALKMLWKNLPQGNV